MTAPAECTLPPAAPPVFTPRPLPPSAPEGADPVAKLKAELARAVDYGAQAVTYADTLRVHEADKHDRDVRCATWAAGLNK